VSHLRRPGALTPVEHSDGHVIPSATARLPAVNWRRRHAAPSRAIFAIREPRLAMLSRRSRQSDWCIDLPPLVHGDRELGATHCRLDTSQSQPLLAQQQAEVENGTAGDSCGTGRTRQAAAEVSRRTRTLGETGGTRRRKPKWTVAHEERANADAALAVAQGKVVDTTAEVTAMQADQTYWQAQIKRSATCGNAGLSPSETIRRAGGKRTQRMQKLLQASTAYSERGRGKVRIGASQSGCRNRRGGGPLQMAQSELTAHLAHVRSATAAVTVASKNRAGTERCGAGPGRSAGRFCRRGLL